VFSSFRAFVFRIRRFVLGLHELREYAVKKKPTLLFRVIRIIELNRVIIEENSLCFIERNSVLLLVYQSLPLIPFKMKHNYTIIPFSAGRQSLCGLA